MKKLFLVALMAMLLVCALTFAIGAKEAYIEEIPNELKFENDDQAQYFVVFDGAEYVKASGGRIYDFNSNEIKDQIDFLGVTVGTTHLIKVIFPSEIDGVTTKTIDFNESIKRSSFFPNCGMVVLPSTVSKVTDMNERASQLRAIDFSSTSELKELPYLFAGRASRLRKIYNYPTALDVINKQAFSGCDGFNGELYVNATSILVKAFENGVGLDVTGIVLGPRVTNIETEAFGTREKRGSTNVTYIEFQCDITQMNIVNSENNLGAFYFSGGSQRNPYSSLTCIILSNPAQADCDGKIFQDYLPKVYFNGQSASDGNPVYSAHGYGEKTVSYENLFAGGTMSAQCTRCAKNESGTPLAPIFKPLGYSCSEAGAPSITFGFMVDYSALDFYNASVEDGKKITAYGVIAANATFAGDTAFETDMTPKAGVISFDLSAMAVKNMWAEIKIVGLSGESYDYTDVALFCTAYVIVGTEVVYFDNGAQSTTLNTSISYNSIKAKNN